MTQDLVVKGPGVLTAIDPTALSVVATQVAYTPGSNTYLTGVTAAAALTEADAEFVTLAAGIVTNSAGLTYSGAGVPSAGLGVNGATYLNTSTTPVDVYLKGAGSWSRIGSLGV